MEAMSFGLPIICINNHFTAPELVLNNSTGFTVETSSKFLKFPHQIFNPNRILNKTAFENLKREDDVKGLKNLIEKLELLIQNKELREKLGNNGMDRVTNGDLSIKFRNKRLINLFS